MTNETLQGKAARVGSALLLLCLCLARWTPDAAGSSKAPSAPAARAPATAATAAPPTSITLHGSAQDQTGNPVRSVIRAVDRQGAVLADILTEADGSYLVVIAGRASLSVSATPLGLPEHWIEMDSGYRVSKYFELTRVIVPSSTDIELTFVFPPASALRILAYTPAGARMLMGEFNEALNPSGFFGYQGVYGAFPMDSFSVPVPTAASIGMLRGASRAELERSQWEPCFAIPPGEAVFLMLPWEVPGVGTFPLRADNRGQGYSLAEGGVQTINLVYELGETEHRRAVELRSSYEMQGRSFSTAVEDALLQASDALNRARSQTDEASRAMLSYEVLRWSIQAKEQMTMEVAEAGIAARKENLTVVVQDEGGNPVPDATVTYRQSRSDFVLGEFGELPIYPFLPATYKACKEIGFEYLFRIDYWNRVCPAAGVFDFSELDRGLERARIEGWDAVAGLTWLGSGTVPPWAEDLEFSEFKQRLRELVKAYIGHLKGKVKYFHVAMEPTIQTVVGSRYVDVEFESGYTTTVQYAELVELVRTVFEAAREVDSGILLGYTVSADYGTGELNPQSWGAWPLPYSFLKSVLESGVSPDYIGLSIYPALGALPQDLSTVAAIIKAYHDLSGLPVLIVEMTSYSSRTEDYGLTGPVPNFYWHEHMTRQAQADWDTSVFKLALSMPYVRGLVMTHGGPDYPGWEPGLPITDCVGIPGCYSVGTDFLSNDYERKPVYYALQDLFDSWRGQGSAGTNPGGTVSFAGLAGDYSIGVTTTEGLLQSFQAYLGPESRVVTVTLDGDQAFTDLEHLVAGAQRAVDWSWQLGRELDYGSLRSRLTAVKSAITAGHFLVARAAAQSILDDVAIDIDGDPADWRGIPPLATLPPGGVLVDAPGIDLKAIYGMTDAEWLYLMLEVYDPPVTLQPGGIYGGVSYPTFGFILRTHPPEEIRYHVLGYLPYTGQIEVADSTGGGRVLATLYSAAYGQVLEFKVPLALLGNPSRVAVVPYVVALDNGEPKGAKGFSDWADVLHPGYAVYLPLLVGK